MTEKEAQDKLEYLKEENLRDAFAGQAMAGLLHMVDKSAILSDSWMEAADDLAIAAYTIANAMVTERAQQTFESMKYE